MADNMFLNPGEITELTGRRRKDAQARILRHIGIEHRVRPNGSLVVLREHVQKLLAGNTVTNVVRKKTEPNWGALNA